MYRSVHIFLNLCPLFWLIYSTKMSPSEVSHYFQNGSACSEVKGCARMFACHSCSLLLFCLSFPRAFLTSLGNFCKSCPAPMGAACPACNKDINTVFGGHIFVDRDVVHHTGTQFYPKAAGGEISPGCSHFWWTF